MVTKILVVDDEPDFLEFVSCQLKTQGFEVLTASNGFDALMQARRARPDLVLLDVMMDGMDGYSVCQSLRLQKTTKRIPVMLVTAASQLITQLNGLTVGADDVLTKPFNSRELFRRIKILVRRK